MRVIHVSPYFAPAFRYGGPPQSILGLCQGLLRAGIDVEVFTTTANGAEPLPAAPEGAWYEGVRVRYFPLSFPRRYWRASGLTGALTAVAGSADLVHVHGLWNFAGWAGVRAARTAGVPYAISPRGMLQPAAISRHRASKAVALAMFERAHLRGAAFLHATSADEARVLGSTNPSVVLVPNGVSPQAVTDEDVQRVRQAAGLAGTAPVVLFLGRIHPIKRLDLVAESFIRLRRVQPDAHLVIAGPDEGGHRRTVEPMFRPVADAVRWVGAISGIDKWAWLRASRALLQCSDSESFGMSVAEALAVGVPVVTSNRGPWSELQAAECALVVPHASEPIALALEQVLGDPAEAQRVGRRAQAWAARRFSWDEIAQTMIRAYDDAFVRARSAA